MKSNFFAGLFLTGLFFGNFYFTFSQTYPAMNISLLGNWFDSTVVSEPQHGIKYNGVFGWANPADGREYAIIGSTAGTYIIEVTDPTQPVMRDFVVGQRDSCIWREVHTYKNYCYIVSDDALPNSFQIIDLSYLPDSVFLVHDSTNIMSRCHTIFVDGDYLYGGIPKGPFGISSLAVFSLKNNPENPFLLKMLEEDYPGMQATHDMFVRNDTVYASMSNGGYFVFRFDTILNKFFLLGSLTSYPYSGYNHSSSVSADGHISVMCDEVPAGLQVKVLDVSDLSDITVKSTFQSNAGATPHNPYMVGNDRVVIAYYQDGIQIYDVSDPANPVRSGFFDTRPEIGDNNGYPGDPYQGAWGAYTRLPSGNIISSDMQNGLFVLDASVALGTHELKGKEVEFQVFPNPGSGFFKVLIPSDAAERLDAEIRAFNILGEEVFLSGIKAGRNAGAAPVMNLDLSNQPAGIYFLVLSGNYFSGSKRIVIGK